MEQHTNEVVAVCWRVSPRTLIVEVFSYFLACAGMVFYFDLAPIITLSGVLLVIVCASITVRRNNKLIGGLYTLNYCNDNACFTTFVRGNESDSLEIRKVDVIWQCSYCALIQIECSEETGPALKQWIYAAETTSEEYARLLRVLR